MKCVKKYEIIKRVSDNIAENLVAKEGWTYTSKKSWKEKTRDVVVKAEAVPVVEVASEVPVVVEEKKKVSGRQRQKVLGNN